MILTMTLKVPPSVNHCYINIGHGAKRLSKFAEQWVDDAKDIAIKQAKKQGWKMVEGEKVVVEIWTYFPDRRRRDTHNGSKVMLDALEGIITNDDRYILPRYMDVSVDKENPRVELKCYKLGA